MDNEAMRFRGGVGEGATRGFQFGAPAVKLFPNMIGADPEGRKVRGISMRHKLPAPYTLSSCRIFDALPTKHISRIHSNLRFPYEFENTQTIQRDQAPGSD